MVAYYGSMCISSYLICDKVSLSLDAGDKEMQKMVKISFSNWTSVQVIGDRRNVGRCSTERDSRGEMEMMIVEFKETVKYGKIAVKR